MRVSWDQVLGWRLRRQFVDPRGRAGTGEIVSRLCGIQAQVGPAAELAVKIRQAKPEADGVRRGLEDRSLVKTWAMRGTLHLLRSNEAGAYLSLMASARTWAKPSWQRVFGATPKEIDQLTEAVATILDGAVLTREELVTALVADQRFHGLADQLRSGWGAVLKPLAWQGALCYGPSSGTKVTFTNPASLIPGWTSPPEPDEAASAVISAYLGAYGPASPEVFDAWLSRNSLSKPVLRRWFAELGGDLTAVDIEGRKAFVLSEHVDELAKAVPADQVRLLGAFDQYILGPGTKDPILLPAAHRAKVSRTAGWISPIVVRAGRVVGIWETEGADLVVTLFPEAEPVPAAALEAEAGHVARASGLTGLKVRMA
ncbi:MAG TPA: winged helix DNA-binding domain-containing protein [Actinocrinis sp.]|nr:winged helix DNA-binding domain-containing protein [Actinocrinis sp.]